MLGEWTHTWLRADLDLRLCRRGIEDGRVFRVRTSGISMRRLGLGVLFGAPAIFVIAVAAGNPYGVSGVARVGLVGLALVPLLAALVFGAARLEKRFDRVRHTLTCSMSLLGMEGHFEETMPSDGVVTLTSQWEEAPHWTFRVSADNVPGATFSIGADYQEGARFGEELAAFLGWPFRDLADPKSRQVP